MFTSIQSNCPLIGQINSYKAGLKLNVKIVVKDLSRKTPKSGEHKLKRLKLKQNFIQTFITKQIKFAEQNYRNLFKKHAKKYEKQTRILRKYFL